MGGEHLPPGILVTGGLHSSQSLVPRDRSGIGDQKHRAEWNPCPTLGLTSRVS